MFVISNYLSGYVYPIDFAKDVLLMVFICVIWVISRNYKETRGVFFSRSLGLISVIYLINCVVHHVFTAFFENYLLAVRVTAFLHQGLLLVGCIISLEILWSIHRSSNKKQLVP